MKNRALYIYILVVNLVLLVVILFSPPERVLQLALGLFGSITVGGIALWKLIGGGEK